MHNTNENYAKKKMKVEKENDTTLSGIKKRHRLKSGAGIAMRAYSTKNQKNIKKKNII